MKGHPTEEKTTFENHTSESGLISKIHNILFSSVQLSHSVMSNSLQPHGLQHTRLICPSPTPRACSNSRPLSRWCPNRLILCCPFSSSLQSFPASRSFQMSQFFESGGWSIASASVLPRNIQNWFPLGMTGLIPLHSKELQYTFTIQRQKSKKKIPKSSD